MEKDRPKKQEQIVQASLKFVFMIFLTLELSPTAITRTIKTTTTTKIVVAAVSLSGCKNSS
jgi:hypothetical protein